jgi:hypothetical protein
MNMLQEYVHICLKVATTGGLFQLWVLWIQRKKIFPGFGSVLKLISDPDLQPARLQIAY